MTVRTTVKEQAEILKNGAKYQAVKAHVKRNKKLYIGIGIGASVVLVTRRPSINIVNAPVFNNNIVNNGGYMRKIVRCIETDEMWPSVSKAAEAVGVTIHSMSNHINGRQDSLNGLHYVIEGLAAG